MLSAGHIVSIRSLEISYALVGQRYPSVALVCTEFVQSPHSSALSICP